MFKLIESSSTQKKSKQQKKDKIYTDIKWAFLS